MVILQKFLQLNKPLPTLWTDSSYLHVHNASWWQSKMQIRFFDCRQLQPQSRRPTVLLTFWSTPQASFRSRTWYNQVDCISTSNHILALQPQFCKHKFPSSNLSETKFFLLSPVCHRDYTKQGSEVGPILVIKVKLTASLQFLFLVLWYQTLYLPVILTSLKLESELIHFWSAHVAITEDWRSLRDRERIRIGCKYERWSQFDSRQCSGRLARIQSF
jgi:hypothetical protein